jgi:translation initiation factor 3 subunit E
LIRNARLDAKIDSQANQILLGAQVTSPYQQLIDKTKGLALRGVVLSNGLERAKNVQKKQKQQEEIPAK